MLSKQLPLFAAVLIALLTIASIGMQLYPFYLESQDTVVASVPVAASSNPNASEKPMYNVASFKVFGNYQATPEPKAESLDKLPTTKLKLTLTGVSADSEQKLGSALIEDPKRMTDRYGIGDELPGGAKLHEVYQDRVIINRGGKLETLFFPESAGGPQLLTSVSQPATDYRDTDMAMPTVMGNISVNNGENGINTGELPSITPAQKQNIRDRLSALRARLKQQ